MTRFRPNNEDDLYEFREKFTERMGRPREKEKKRGTGNIEGLAKHLANKYGADPEFFSMCMSDDELQDYDHEARAAICARAHKIVTGIWPSEHRRNASLEKKEFVTNFTGAMTKKKL